MSREKRQIYRLLRQVKSSLEQIESMMAEPVKNEFDHIQPVTVSAKKIQIEIKDEPLKVEKIAILVYSEIELASLYKKYKFAYDVETYSGYGYPKLIRIKEDKALPFTLNFAVEKDAIHDGYTIIDFDFWAAQNGVEIPEFIMKSQDGIDLFGGSEAFGVALNPSLNKWALSSFHNGNGPFILSDSKCEPDEDFPYLTSPSHNKLFSTKESAESWIKESNKPKIAHTKLFDKDYRSVSSKAYIDIYCKDHLVIRMMPSDIEDILQAYNSLHQ